MRRIPRRKALVLGSAGLIVLLLFGWSRQYAFSHGSDLKVRVSFSVGAVVNVSDGTFSCTGKDTATNTSITDMQWTQRLELLDGLGHLVGVPDSESPSRATDGSCSVTFLFSRLHLPQEPLVIKTLGESRWNIPPSDWQDGLVELDGDTATF
jgi:hypothetical protein